MSSPNQNKTKTRSESPKFHIEIGDLKITSTAEPTAKSLQAILDHTLLQSNAQLRYQQERDKEQSLYVAVAAIFICLGLFTVSYSFVRAIASTFKTSEISHARQTFS